MTTAESGEARCVGCGCTDSRACINANTGEACHWLRLDRETGVGVCSECSRCLDDWDEKRRAAGFTVGDRVVWHGRVYWSAHAVKRDMVIQVVSAGRAGFLAMRKRIDALVSAGGHRSAYGGGLARDHKSYLVEVEGNSTGAKKVLYWPRVSALWSAN